MCLHSLDKKPKKHKHGYKVFKPDGEYYQTTIMGLHRYYKIGNTYDAKGITAELNETDYPLGFHYYLRLKDAKAVLRPGRVVIRVKGQNIFATGLQEDWADNTAITSTSAVSEFITLEKLMFRFKESEPESLLSIFRKESVVSDIIEFMRKHDPSPHTPTVDWVTLAKLLCASEENYEKYICFIDCFPRQSSAFKLMTALHIWSMDNFKTYRKQYDNIMKSHKELTWKAAGFIPHTLSELDVMGILFGE